MARVDLSLVLRDAAEMVAARAAAMEAQVVLDLPDEPIWVKGGEVRLGQVFVNLMTNALDAMTDSAERRLTISLSSLSPLCVEVRDTGPGVEVPEKVFDPFYTTKAVGAAEGRGLGLSISYGLVQTFGGNIRGANRPECGAVFTVELDRWEGEKAA